MLRVAVPSLVVVALSLPAGAQARTSRADWVVPRPQISCYVLQYGTGLECLAPSESDPTQDGGAVVALHRTGKARLGQRSDFPGYGPSPGPQKLRAGDTWRPGRSAKGIVCRVRTSGIRCTNRSGHGFRVNHVALRRF